MIDIEQLNELRDKLIDMRLVYNNTDFAQRIGKARSYVSEALNGRRAITEQFILSISDAFPEISKDWLLTGEGEMLAKPKIESNAEMVDPSTIHWITVPVIPYKAMAGSTGWYEDVFAENWGERRTVMAPPGAKAKEHAIFTVTGDSMLPTLIEGDEILAKHVPFDCYKENRLRIYNYSIWIIATMGEGILIKNITEHDVERHTITCHSYNDKYPDFTLDLADVKDIYHAVFLMRNY